jgi:hypothetical protein
MIPVTCGLESLSRVFDKIKIIPVERASSIRTPAVRIDSVTATPKSWATGSARKYPAIALKIGRIKERNPWAICVVAGASILTISPDFNVKFCGFEAWNGVPRFAQVGLLQFIQVSLRRGMTVAIPSSYLIIQALSRIKISLFDVF